MWRFNQTPHNDWLEHYGITGQKWGVRRFQNEDRTLTEAGKERYGRKAESDHKKTGRDKAKDIWNAVQRNPEKYYVAEPDQWKAFDDAYQKKQKTDKKFNDLWKQVRENEDRYVSRMNAGGKKSKKESERIDKERWENYFKLQDEIDDRDIELRIEAAKETLPKDRLYGTLSAIFDEDFNEHYRD